MMNIPPVNFLITDRFEELHNPLAPMEEHDHVFDPRKSATR